MTIFGKNISISDNGIYEQWMQAKADEAKAVQKRRELEDEMSKAFGLEETHEVSMTKKEDEYVIKITQRLNESINQELLNSIVTENGLEDITPSIFKFKPEIIRKGWDQADPKITSLLSEAITMKAGRPSYTIFKKE